MLLVVCAALEPTVGALSVIFEAGAVGLQTLMIFHARTTGFYGIFLFSYDTLWALLF
jgi:hypothetical protein